jgi:nucleotide-binding universal stress UspA family protein
MVMTTSVATPREALGRPTLLTRPVLLADRGSDHTDAARRAAADLAAPAGLPLHTVTAWGSPHSRPAAMLTSVPAEAWDLHEESAREAQDEVRRRLAALGATSVSGHLIEGRTADVIVHTAESIDASLVVIGSHGGDPLSNHVLRSVADEVVHAVRQPVLVVRGDPTSWPPRAVIVGDSPSAEVLPAARSGAFLAAMLGIPISLVRALPDHAARSQTDTWSSAAVRGELFARAMRLRRETGMPATSEIVRGDPASALMALAAQTTPPALITLARPTRGRRGLTSLTVNVLHHAAGPVLVVPDPPFER